MKTLGCAMCNKRHKNIACDAQMFSNVYLQKVEINTKKPVRDKIKS